jgi:hypothetical protein
MAGGRTTGVDGSGLQAVGVADELRSIPNPKYDHAVSQASPVVGTALVR